MIIGIYQSLIIHILFLFHDVDSFSIKIEGNVSGILGQNGTKIECSYTRENVREINRVDIWAFNRSSVAFEQIAVYIPDDISTLLPQGQYLKGRVTLMNITQSSTKAVMIFNKLMCIDDTFYKCRVKYTDTSVVDREVFSSNMTIQVQVTPSKPDKIFLINVTTDVSSTTLTVPMSATTSSSSSVETISTMDIDEQNDITASTHSTLQTTDHNTTSSPPSGDDLFNDSSYRTTTQSIQQTTTTTALGISEGDNITVVCTGYVGKPPAEHVFQKYRSDNILSMNYTATETFISEIFENCSYYRTSNLTFQVTAEDNNAVIRCVVNSSMTGTDMFIETKPIEVYYEVSMPTITKYPNKTNYVVDEDTSINLTCKSDGNPKPYYQWYKENNELMSTSANWTITDINVTNSGEYTCKVSNTFNGDTHTNAKHVQINIMNKAYTTRITLEHSSTLDDVPTTQSSLTCSTSCIGKKEEKSEGNFNDIPTTQSSSICSSSCVDKKEEESNGKWRLVAGIVGAIVAVIVVIIVIIACRRRKSKSPTSKNVSKSFDDSKPKSVTEPRTGDYDSIALEDDPPKAKSSNNGLEVEDIKKQNEEYLKKQEEQEKKQNESNTPAQPAVYAQVNETSKLKNKQNTETPGRPDKQEEDPYAETQEDVYDEAGNPRYKENKNAEQFDVSTNSSKNKSNDDNKLSKQTSQVGSYANQGFEKDENRKVATVSPTIRSSSGSQNDEQTNSNRNSQSKKEYENIIGTDQTGIFEEDSSHRTAL